MGTEWGGDDCTTSVAPLRTHAYCEKLSFLPHPSRPEHRVPSGDITVVVQLPDGTLCSGRVYNKFPFIPPKIKMAAIAAAIFI